jgi:TonB family protein
MMLAMSNIKSLRSDNVCCLIVTFGTLFLCPHLLTQSGATPAVVPETEARQHLTQKVDPVYPPIAAAARVQGDVVISVLIDVRGHVGSEKPISGPPMLRQAALDAVKKWQFTPFTANGDPEPATTILTIPFQLGGPKLTPDQEKAAQAWFPLSGKCRSALRSQNKDDALTFCKQALDTSFQAGDLTNSDQLARLDSHQLYGHALLMNGRAQEALDQENLAIGEARKCLTENDEEYATPFVWRAVVEANLGQGDAALADFKTAEETYRRAIVHLPDMKNIYSKDLASTLRTHAALLDAMGRTAEAEKLRAEAAAL